MLTYERAGTFLTQWLEENGMTAAELSRQVGIDPGILRSIVTGKRKSISMRNIVTLSQYFGMDIHQLMERIR